MDPATLGAAVLAQAVPVVLNTGFNLATQVAPVVLRMLGDAVSASAPQLRALAAALVRDTLAANAANRYHMRAPAGAAPVVQGGAATMRYRSSYAEQGGPADTGAVVLWTIGGIALIGYLVLKRGTERVTQATTDVLGAASRLPGLTLQRTAEGAHQAADETARAVGGLFGEAVSAAAAPLQQSLAASVSAGRQTLGQLGDALTSAATDAARSLTIAGKII